MSAHVVFSAAKPTMTQAELARFGERVELGGISARIRGNFSPDRGLTWLSIGGGSKTRNCEDALPKALEPFETSAKKAGVPEPGSDRCYAWHSTPEVVVVCCRQRGPWMSLFAYKHFGAPDLTVDFILPE